MQELRTTEFYRDQECRLIAIELIELGHSRYKNSAQVYASISPLAVVMCRQDGYEILALDMPARLKQQSRLLDLISSLCF